MTTDNNAAPSGLTDLLQRCRELLELADAGESPQIALRALADTYHPEISAHDRRSMAVAQTHLEAMRALLAAAPKAAEQAGQEPTSAEFEVAVETLRHIIDCLRKTGSYTDEEGEATDFLVPLLEARLAAPLPRASDAAAHPDDLAVDAFAAAMKEKLALARAKGRGGWEQCEPAELSVMLRGHVEKGDPRDVANFCMFLWNLKAPISKVGHLEFMPIDRMQHEMVYGTREAIDALKKRMERDYQVASLVPGTGKFDAFDRWPWQRLHPDHIADDRKLVAQPDERTSPRTYTTKPGESVMGIALRECGSEAEWRHILACNPKFAELLPNDYFPFGTVINLPARIDRTGGEAC